MSEPWRTDGVTCGTCYAAFIECGDVNGRRVWRHPDGGCVSASATWTWTAQVSADPGSPSPRSLSAEMRDAGLARWADRVALVELRLARCNELGGTTADVSAARQETIYERDAVIERLRAALTLERQQHQETRALLERAGIIEIAVRNVNVSSYVDHWEGRALKAEASLAQREAEIAQIRALVPKWRNVPAVNDWLRSRHECANQIAALLQEPTDG